MPSREPQRLLTVKDVSKVLDLSNASVYSYVKRGAFADAVVRIGPTIRFHPDRFQAWLDAGGLTPQPAETE